MVQGNFSMEVVVTYNKSDGKIVRVCSLPAHLVGKKSNQDINRMFPDTDTSNFNMVIVKGKQYLEIERFKVITEKDGEFVDIVEKVNKLSHFEEEAQISSEILDREVDVVLSILSVIDDPERLKKYKQLEQENQNRPEVLNFFIKKNI